MIRTLSLPSWFGLTEPKAQMAKVKATGPVVSVKTLSKTTAGLKGQAARGNVIIAKAAVKPRARRWHVRITMPWQWVHVGLAAAIVVIAASYMIGINTYATKGYALKTVQKRVAVLQEEHKKLVIDQAAHASMRLVADAATSRQLVPVTTVEQIIPKQLSKR